MKCVCMKNEMIPMSERVSCPKCGNVDANKLREVEDKDKKPLYFSMQGAPVYPKKYICGACTHSWPKSQY